LSEKSKNIIVMECSCSYSLLDESDVELEKGEALVKLDEETLSVLPKMFGESLFISFRDILEIFTEDYKVFILLTSREKLTIFDLGYKYEDFIRILLRLRNELILKDLLMQETLRKSGIKANFVCFENKDNKNKKGICEIRLYETAFVIIPEDGELKRIPYSEILEIKDEDYTLILLTESRAKWIFSEIGRDFDSLVNTLSQLVNELSLKVQSSLKELLPGANPSIVRQASRFMKEGRAARRSDIESVSSELWSELEKKVKSTDIGEEYGFLESISWKDKICIGLKRGLLGDLTGEYIWFLIPIYSTNPEEPGNAVAMEAISEEGGGKATYFFRIMSRKDYLNCNKVEDLHCKVDSFIEDINRCMLAINFRREPIYLSDEKLDDLKYQKYKFAIAKIPELQNLRELFIGRVIHSSFEQWKKDVMDLLRFNVHSKEDNERWEKE